MIVTRLVKIHLYARKPAETANFYATLGCEVIGPVDPADPWDLPVYLIALPLGLDLWIFQLTDASDTNPPHEKMLLVFEVGSSVEVTQRLMAAGLYEAAEEPRVVPGEGGNCVMADPDSRLVGLDGAGLSRLMAFGEAKNWRAISATRYCNGDFVLHDGVVYECSVDHEAQEGSPPPAEALGAKSR
jgi:hypothetical protein